MKAAEGQVSAAGSWGEEGCPKGIKAGICLLLALCAFVGFKAGFKGSSPQGPSKICDHLTRCFVWPCNLGVLLWDTKDVTPR